MLVRSHLVRSWARVTANPRWLWELQMIGFLPYQIFLQRNHMGDRHQEARCFTGRTGLHIAPSVAITVPIAGHANMGFVGIMGDVFL